MNELISRDEMANVARWCELVEQLATDAEGLQAPEPGMDDRAYREEWQALGDRWMACCWTALTPPFIAASARLARAKVCPQPLQLREEGTPEGYHLISDAEMDQWLVVKSERARIEAQKAEGKWQRKPKPLMGRPFEEPKQDDAEQAAAERRAAYAAKKAAERAVEEQAAAAREARVLEIAAASAPAVVEPEPEALPVEKVEPPDPDPGEPADDGRAWLIATDLADALGTTKQMIAHYRRVGVLDGLWKLPAPDRVRGALFDVEACRAAIEARKAAPRTRKRKPPAEPPAAMPVVIEEIEPQGPAVEPEAPVPGTADAAALLELVGDDPAVLEALRALLVEGKH